MHVTVVEALDRLVPMEEPEAGEVLAEVFAGEGIGVRVGAKVTEVAADGDGVIVTLGDGATVSAERLLVATGRKADVAAVGLGAIGVDESARWLSVDGHQRVTDGVWAVGDLVGEGAFTDVATYQSAIAVADILGQPPPGCHRPPADGCTEPATTGSSSWSPTGAATSWSGRPPWDPPMARCWDC